MAVNRVKPAKVTFASMTGKANNAHEYYSEEEEVKPPPKKHHKKRTTAQAAPEPAPALSASQMEQLLNQMRKEYAMSVIRATEPDDDQLSVSSIKSSSRTRTNQVQLDDDFYLNISRRLFVLENFTIAQLRSMSNARGRSPQGASKREILANTVLLAKIKMELIDMILSASPEDD